MIWNLFAPDDAGDVWNTLGLVRCLDGDFVDVIDELFAIQRTCRFPVALVVRSLVWRQKPILKPIPISFIYLFIHPFIHLFVCHGQGGSIFYGFIFIEFIEKPVLNQIERQIHSCFWFD